MTVKASQPSRKELRLGVLGCGFMGKCHTNAYKKIPYIYAGGRRGAATAGALRQAGSEGPGGGGPLRL